MSELTPMQKWEQQLDDMGPFSPVEKQIEQANKCPDKSASIFKLLKQNIAELKKQEQECA